MSLGTAERRVGEGGSLDFQGWFLTPKIAPRQRGPCGGWCERRESAAEGILRRRNEDDFDSPTAEGRQDNRFDLDDQRRDRPTTTVRQRLTTFLRQSLYLVVVVVVLLCLAGTPPTLPSAPINSHKLPLYSPSPTPSAPQQPCPTPSISPTLPPPCTPCGTFAFSTSFVTRGPPSPASTLPSPPNG